MARVNRSQHLVGTFPRSPVVGLHPVRCKTRRMPELRSKTSTSGRNMAGARALWRATGMTDDDFGKPIVAIANSFTQFVPGHVHLRNLGMIVADAVKEAGGVAKE